MRRRHQCAAWRSPLIAQIAKIALITKLRSLLDSACVLDKGCSMHSSFVCFKGILGSKDNDVVILKKKKMML